MGNLFLGFPVPRAKIADMISTAAPPLEHKANHLPNGSDPIVAPEDITTDQVVKWNGTKFVGADAGGGGLASVIEDTGWFYAEHFRDLTYFQTNETNLGTTTYTYGYRSIKSAANGDSYYKLQKFNGYLFAFPIYDYKIAWKARVRLIDYRTTDGFSRIVAGCVDWYPGFGFELKGRNLYGAIYNASDWFYTDSLKAWGGNIDEIIELKAIFYPAEKIEFYINDVLEDTYSVVANLPAGVSEESPLISLYIENMGEAAEGHIRISRFEIEQYA